MLENGSVIILDKPLRWTSFDVCNRLRILTRVKKIGHAGTLDPLATGLLIVCTGKATKTIDSIQSQTKVYEAEVQLGYITPSFDLETEPIRTGDVAEVTTERIRLVLPQFVGNIKQLPPIYSAIRKEGKRLYEHARRNEKVEIAPRAVEIHSIELLNFMDGIVSIRVVCGKGTYIRSLANDIGAALGCGGFLKSLRRTANGEFNEKDMLTLDEFEGMLESAGAIAPRPTRSEKPRADKRLFAIQKSDFEKIPIESIADLISHENSKVGE